MKSIFSLSCAAIAVLAASCTASDPTRTELLEARWLPVTYKGCYSSAGSLKENGTYLYQTQDYCQQSMCGPAGYSVEATSNSTYCYCGSEVPSSSLLIDDSLCNSPCAGFGNDTCGGETTFSVYLTGVGTVSGPSGPSSSSSASSKSSPTASAPPSVVTVGGQTVVVTAGATTNAASSSSPNKAAIAAGVVVGFVAFAAAAGGGFFYMRRRRNRQVEEEYRRNAAVNEFVAGGKSHHSGNTSFSDTRLDPTVMAQRRMSDGSIADNEDYSRRILKVTNA